jgi:hypothetical protein
VAAAAAEAALLAATELLGPAFLLPSGDVSELRNADAEEEEDEDEDEDEEEEPPSPAPAPVEEEEGWPKMLVCWPPLARGLLSKNCVRGFMPVVSTFLPAAGAGGRELLAPRESVCGGE